MGKRKIRRAAVLAAASMLLAAGGTMATAMDGRPPGRFEIAVFWGSNRPSLDASYAHAFVPALLPGNGTGSGSQTLSLRGDRSSSGSLVASFFPGRVFGIQVLGAAFTTGLGGSNTPYRVVLNYTSRQPPDYAPRPATYERQTSWPDTTGELEERILAVNAVVRFHPAAGLTVAVSAGPARYWVDGRAASLGYTKFTLGGHGVLFPYEYRLDLDFERTAAWGFDAGVEAALDVLPWLGLALDARYFGAGTKTVPFVWTLHGDPGDSFPIDLEAEAIPRPPAELDLGLVRWSAGLKIRF